MSTPGHPNINLSFKSKTWLVRCPIQTDIYSCAVGQTPVALASTILDQKHDHTKLSALGAECGAGLVIGQYEL